VGSLLASVPIIAGCPRVPKGTPRHTLEGGGDAPSIACAPRRWIRDRDCPGVSSRADSV